MSEPNHPAARGAFLRTVLRDLRHHLDGPLYETPLELSAARFLRALIAPEFRVVLSFRVSSLLHARGLRWLAYLVYLRAKRKYHCDIYPTAVIGAGLRVAHCSDIVIGPLVVFGEDVEVFNGVTLGNQRTRGGVWGMPRLGDRVLLGTGAKLLGDIEIGDDAKIGANAVVLQSVPCGATAVGIPARILR